MHIPITLNINTDHIGISDLVHNEDTSWCISAVVSVPDGLQYDIQWPARVDRMRIYIGPVVVPDQMMQVILGEYYQGVITAMSLGSFSPSRLIQELLISALGVA